MKVYLLINLNILIMDIVKDKRNFFFFLVINTEVQ